MKKRKLNENLIALPDDLIKEISTFLDAKEQLVNVSCLSKEFQKFYSEKSVLENLMKQNGLFIPNYNKELPPHLFYWKIFFPMQETKINLEKIYELFPSRFLKESTSKTLQEYIESNPNYSFPPSFQLFYTFCSCFGKVEQDYLQIWGSYISKSDKIQSFEFQEIVGNFLFIGGEMKEDFHFFE
jgi:hypothetical protein